MSIAVKSIATGLVTAGTDKVFNGSSYKTAAMQGVVSAGSVYSVDMIYYLLPQNLLGFLGAYTEDMVSSLVYATVCYLAKGKYGIKSQGWIKDILMHFGSIVAADYIATPVSQVLPSGFNLPSMDY